MPERPVAHQRPTGDDVARLAGVAQSSVSLVFSGKSRGRVSRELEERIRRAAAELDYQPINTGRALRMGQSNAVGLAITDFENAFFGTLSRGAQRAAAARGYSLLLMESHHNGESFTPYRSLDAGHVDGLLLFGIDPPPRPPTKRRAIVLIECVDDGFPSVVFSVHDGLSAIMGHLKDLGHRDIAYLGTNNRRWTFRQRRRAWEDAMDEHRLACRPEFIVETPITLESAVRGASSLLSGDALPTAVVCADDIQAAGVYHAANALGMRIPADLSVTSFGETIVGRVLTPSVTTIAASGADLGATAVNLQFAGGWVDGSPQRLELPVTLRIRDSTAPPPGDRSPGRRHRN